MPELQVLAHGPGWLALDKPAGISVHNDPEGKTDLLALARALLLGDHELSHACGWQGDFALSPVHRLDRETSGAILLAVRREAARELQPLFEDRTEKKARKIYRAIVRGQLKSRAGEWNQPLSDKSEGRKNPAGKAQDRTPCLTRYETVNANPYLTEIEVDLMTGRQHQIRKHAAIAGHAIVGDSRYGDPKYNAMIARRFGMERMLLHAWRLEIELPPGLAPLGSPVLSVEAPLPEAFATVFGTSNSIHPANQSETT